MIRKTLTVAVLLGAAAVLAPGSLAQEQLSNGRMEGGHFAAGNDDQCPIGWTLHETRPGEPSQARSVADNGPSYAGSVAWEFFRNGGVSGDWTCLEQTLNVDVTGLDQVILKIDTKVTSHDLEGGGWGSPAWEWPVEVMVWFTDTNDVGQIWHFGWYVDPPGDGRVVDPGRGSISEYKDKLVTTGKWLANTFDLLQELPDVRTITKVRVGGSGWSYLGRIDNVSLQLREVGMIVESKLLSSGDNVTFDTFGGTQFHPVMLFLTAVNHVPLPISVALGMFNAGGHWTLSATVPADPGLVGNHLTMRSYALGGAFSIEETNTETMTFE